MALPAPIKRTAQSEGDSAPPQPAIKRRPSANRPSISTITSMPGWTRAQDPLTKRLVVNVEGEWKAGKNFFAFSFPGPIYIHSFDKRIRGVVEIFQDEKEIYVLDYPSPIEIQQAVGDDNEEKIASQSREVWDWFVAKFDESVEKTAMDGTVIVDTGTEAYQLRILAEFGRLKRNNSFGYEEPKAEFRHLVRRSQLGTNAVWIHKYKDLYSKPNPSNPNDRGQKIGRKFAGMADFQYLVDINLRAQRNDLEGGGSEYTVEVLDCGIGKAAEINGMVIPNDYDTLAAIIFPE
jgi:hypothetical protein